MGENETEIDALCSLFDDPMAGNDEPAFGNAESVDELLGLLAPPEHGGGASSSSAAIPSHRSSRHAGRDSTTLDRRRPAVPVASGHDIVGAPAEQVDEQEPDLPDPTIELPPEVTAVPMVIIACFNLRCEVDVKALAFKLRNAEYNPRKQPCVCIRLRDGNTALVRTSGKASLMGKCNEDDIKLSAKHVARLIQKCGWKEAKFADFKVVNIGCVADVQFPVRLDRLASKWRRNATYEPEIYSGVVFKTRKPKCNYNITSGGKVKIGGCNSLTKVTDCLRRIYPVLLEFSS